MELKDKEKLKQIAFDIFGTADGIRPKMPKRGEPIQEAIEASFKAGKDSELEGRAEWGKLMYQAGVKEAVEWIENHGSCLDGHREAWRAFKKSKGI